MKRTFLFILTLSFVSQIIRSQGELDEQKKIFYRNERSLAILINSNGLGINGRYAKRIDAFKKTIYDFDIVSFKHPKEYRHLSQLSPSSRGYIFGKINSVFVFRPGFGIQKEIFRKLDIGGISIRNYYTIGPSLAVLKPIYYEYIDNAQNIHVNKFNRDSADYIIGKGSFFKGFNQLQVRPGAFFKYGFCFEYSRYDQVIHAIEGGAIAEAFATKLPIMDTKQNYQFYLTLFISYRFGKVIDTFQPNQNTNTPDSYNY